MKKMAGGLDKKNAVITFKQPRKSQTKRYRTMQSRNDGGYVE